MHYSIMAIAIIWLLLGIPLCIITAMAPRNPMMLSRIQPLVRKHYLVIPLVTIIQRLAQLHFTLIRVVRKMWLLVLGLCVQIQQAEGTPVQDLIPCSVIQLEILI